MSSRTLSSTFPSRRLRSVKTRLKWLSRHAPSIGPRRLQVLADSLHVRIRTFIREPIEHPRFSPIIGFSIIPVEIRTQIARELVHFVLQKGNHTIHYQKHNRNSQAQRIFAGLVYRIEGVFDMGFAAIFQEQLFSSALLATISAKHLGGSATWSRLQSLPFSVPILLVQGQDILRPRYLAQLIESSPYTPPPFARVDLSLPVWSPWLRLRHLVIQPNIWQSSQSYIASSLQLHSASKSAAQLLHLYNSSISNVETIFDTYHHDLTSFKREYPAMPLYIDMQNLAYRLPQLQIILVVQERIILRLIDGKHTQFPDQIQIILSDGRQRPRIRFTSWKYTQETWTIVSPWI